MKKIFPYLAIALCAAILPACSDDDDENGGSGFPEGSEPSAEFVPNNLPDEPFANEAIKVVATNPSTAPFYSLELMGDGHYLMSFNESNYQLNATVSTSADGSVSFKKSRSSQNRIKSRTDENGTIYLDNGDIYGKYSVIGDKQYKLDTGDEVEIVEEDDEVYVEVTPDDTHETIIVTVTVHFGWDGSASGNIYRTWNTTELEYYDYINEELWLRVRGYLKNDEWSLTVYKNAYNVDLDELDLFTGEEVKQVVFTGAGTCIWFYLDDEVEVLRWRWESFADGEIIMEDQETTIRFFEDQMRLYQEEEYDYTTDVNEPLVERMVGIATFSAAY